VFGRAVESTLGPLRMIALFVVSAVVGNLFALLTQPGPAILVGASGGVLGIFGVRLAVVARRLRGKPTRFLRGELLGALFLVGAQVAFDLSVPAISSAAHAAGFATGLALGLASVSRT
jgi:membrane associated rhomboid family serine protease